MSPFRFCSLMSCKGGSTGFVGNRTLCVLQSAWPLLRYDPKAAQWFAVSLKLHQSNKLDVAAL
ncbi:MAG TPA: hypothetical protein DCE55_21135 [Planctomycetaceae bacterium]|nr:hypothetical protein [Planctomycetaceae bacterium]